MVTPKEALASAEEARTQRSDVAVLEHPVEMSEEVKEQAAKEFAELQAKQREISDEIQKLYSQFDSIDLELKDVAARGGEVYVPFAEAQENKEGIPEAVIDQVIEEGLSDIPGSETSKKRAETIVEEKLARRLKNHAPKELGQVILQADHTEDTLSQKAFANTAPDTREHRRVSTAAPEATPTPATHVEVIAEPTSEAVPVHHEAKAPVEKTLEEKAEKPQEFATFGDYVAHARETRPFEEGIIPEGDNFVNATNHQYRSAEDYNAYLHAKEKETASNSYYDKVNDANNEAKESKKYSKMSVTELAAELARIRYTNPGDGVHEDPDIEKIQKIAEKKYRAIAKISGDKRDAGMEEFNALAERYEDMLRDKETAARREVEPVGAKEKVKAFWNKTKEHFGLWTDRWNNMLDKQLNKGVLPEMRKAEADPIRNKNRSRIIMGAIGASLVGGLTLGIGGTAVVQGMSGPEQTYSASASDHYVVGPASFHQELPGAPIEAPAPPAPAVEAPNLADPAFTVEKDEGGYELFQELNLTPQQWNDNAEKLLTLFPTSFYRMDNGSVGLKYAGLSTPARAYIEKLRGQ